MFLVIKIRIVVVVLQEMELWKRIHSHPRVIIRIHAHAQDNTFRPINILKFFVSLMHSACTYTYELGTRQQLSACCLDLRQDEYSKPIPMLFVSVTGEEELGTRDFN